MTQTKRSSVSTIAGTHIGRYAVHLNANDIAVLDARPLRFFGVMLLPECHTTAELAETILADVRWNRAFA